MKIVSKFSDYYDCVRQYGIDPSVYYERLTKQVNHPKLSKSKMWAAAREIAQFSTAYNGSTSEKLSGGALIFCGKIYPLFIYEWYDSTENAYNNRYKQAHFVNFEKFLDTLDSSGGLRDWARCARNNYIDNSPCRGRYDLDKWMEQYQKVDFTAECIAVGAPVFYIIWNHHNLAEGKITINPPLKAMGVKEFFSPEQAYQELAMFIAANLSKARPTPPKLGEVPPIKNDDRITLAGFDLKESFRKESRKRGNKHG